CSIVLLLLLFVLCAGAWTWPVKGPVLEAFSFDPAHPYAAGQHRGIAIGADSGTPVLAPASGVVSFAGTVPTSGKTLTIQTPDGLAVSLTHLGSIAVARDDAVSEGSVVGTVGPSGTAEFTEPYGHLGTGPDRGARARGRGTRSARRDAVAGSCRRGAAAGRGLGGAARSFVPAAVRRLAARRPDRHLASAAARLTAGVAEAPHTSGLRSCSCDRGRATRS